MSALRGFVVASLALSAAACWSLTTDTSDIFGGGAAPPTQPPSVVAEAGSDAPTDSQLPSPTRRFCAGVDASARLCADFEEDAGLGPSDVALESGGTARFAERDGGRALRLEGPAGQDSPRALLSHVANGRPKEAWIRFDLAALALTSGGPAISILAFVFRRQTGYYQVALWLDESTQIGIVEFGTIGPEGSVFAPTPLTRGAFHRVELHVVFDGGAAASLSVDGAVVAGKPIGPIPDADEAKTVLELGMSVGPPAPTESTTVLLFDDIAYDLVVR